MSVLSSNRFLQNLIQTGPDASLNLFAVNFKKFGESDYDSKLSLRVKNFPTPKRDVGTVDLPYQNTVIKQIAPSTNIDRTIQFDVRIDEQYKVLSALRNMQVINKFGAYDIDERFSYTITVDALRPYQSLTTTEQYITTYRWVFYEAYITSIGSMTFNYESASVGSVPVEFVYKYFEEYPYDVSMENKRFWNSIKETASNIKEAIFHKEDEDAEVNVQSE